MTDAETTRDLIARLQRHYIKPGQDYATVGEAVEVEARNQTRRGDRMLALTPKGHYALLGYNPDLVDALGGIVWLPVLRLRWYQDKPRQVTG